MTFFVVTLNWSTLDVQYNIWTMCEQTNRVHAFVLSELELSRNCRFQNWTVYGGSSVQVLTILELLIAIFGTANCYFFYIKATRGVTAFTLSFLLLLLIYKWSKYKYRQTSFKQFQLQFQKPRNRCRQF